MQHIAARCRRFMVVLYVSLDTSLASSETPAKRVYALLLADVSGYWAEVDVQPSTLSGYGVYPSHNSGLDWSNVGDVPVLMVRERVPLNAPADMSGRFSHLACTHQPYLGVETVVHDSHALEMIVKVLKGNFERVTIEQVQQQHHGGQPFTADGLFAVPAKPNEKPLQGRKSKASHVEAL